LLLVYRPPSGSFITVCRSTDLPVSPSSPAVGLRTSRRLRCRPAVCLRTSRRLRCCPTVCLRTSRCLCRRPVVGLRTSRRLRHRPLQRKAVGRGLILRASTRPSRSPYCSGVTLRVRLCDALFFFPSPRPTGSTLPSRLRLTSLWSAFRPSLKVCWLHLIPVRPAVLQAMSAPCLHLKPWTYSPET
jgi:hypothetical protein